MIGNTVANPDLNGGVPATGELAGIPPQAGAPDAEQMTAAQHADAFLAGLEQSPEAQAYRSHLESLDQAERARLNGVTPQSEQDAYRDVVSADVSREATGIRDNVYRKTYIENAREMARAAHDAGADVPESAIHFSAEHAAREATRAHDRMINREIAFSRAHTLANLDIDMIFHVMDIAHDMGQRTGDLQEFNHYADRLSPKLQAKYLEHLDARGDGTPPPPAADPTPTGGQGRRRPPTGDGTERANDDDQGNRGGRGRWRDRLPQWPADQWPRGRGRRAQNEGDQDQAQDQGGEQAPTGGRTPRLIGRLASGAMARLRAANARRQQTREQRDALDSEWLDDEAVARYYQLDRYGLQAPARREQEQAPRPEEDTHDARGRAMVARLFEQGAGESAEDYRRRLDETYNDNRRYYRRYSDRHPFSPNFNVTAMADRLAGDIERDHADEDVPEGGTPYTRAALIDHVRRDNNVTRWEAAAIVDTLQERGFLTEGPGRGRKAQLIYGASEAPDDSQE